MSIEPSPEALKAAAVVLANGLLAGGWDSCSAWERESFCESAEDILTAALPALERQIRDHVTQEIWEARNRVYCATPPTPTDAALKAGYAYAYRIAQGRD